jgi:hypothetical protein
VRVGHWYKVRADTGEVFFEHQEKMLERAAPRVRALPIFPIMCIVFNYFVVHDEIVLMASE